MRGQRNTEGAHSGRKIYVRKELYTGYVCGFDLPGDRGHNKLPQLVECVTGNYLPLKCVTDNHSSVLPGITVDTALLNTGLRRLEVYIV